MEKGLKKPAAAKMAQYVVQLEVAHLEIVDFYKVRGGGTVPLEWSFEDRPKISKSPGRKYSPSFKLGNCAGARSLLGWKDYQS